MLALGLAAFGGLHLVLHLRQREAWTRVAGLAVLTGVAMCVPLLLLFMARGATPMAPTFPRSFEGWSIGETLSPALPFLQVRSLDLYGPLPDLDGLEAAQAETEASPFLIWRFFGNMQQQRLLLFSLDRYICDPGLILEPPYLLACLVVPLLLWGLRSDEGAQFTVGTILAVLFVMFNPVVTPLIGSLVVPWLLWRMVWLLPYALAIALAAQRVLNALVAGAVRLFRLKGAAMGQAQNLPLQAGAAVAFVLAVTLALRPSIASTLEEMKDGASAARLYPAPEGILARLDEETTRSGPVTVAADQAMSVVIPAYVADANILAQRALQTSEIFPAEQQEEALQRLIDQNRLFSTPLLTTSSIEILQRYDARYVITPSGSDLDLQLRLADQWFEWLLDDDSYSLYAVREMPTVTASIRGNTALRALEWEAAQAAYQAALEEDSSDLLALVGLAEAYRGQGEFDQALATLEQAAAERDLPTLHYRLGQLYGEMGETERSVAEFDRAQAAAPQVARFHVAMGDACLSAERLECARAQYEAAVAAEDLPDESAQLITLGEMWQKRGEDELALSLYEQAVELRPNESNQYTLIGVYQSLKRYDEAEALLQGLQEDKPLSAKATAGMASLRGAQGRIDEATALYQQTIRLQELLVRDTAHTHLSLAQALMEADRLKEARAEIEQALELQPQNATAYTLLGNLYLKQRHPELAMEAFQMALEIDPTQVAAYISLDDQYRQQAASPDENVALLETATQTNPDQAVLFVSLGDQLRRRGSTGATITAYQLAVDLSEPDTSSSPATKSPGTHVLALANSRLASVYEDQGLLKAAESHAHAAALAAPNEAWTHVALGDLWRRRNDLASAETAYRRAMRTDADYVEAYLSLADLLNAQGDRAGASALYEEALQIATAQGDERQEAKAWLDAGSFYSQSRPEDLYLGSWEEDGAPSDARLDPATEGALYAFAQAVETSDDLATVRALARLYQEIGQTEQAVQIYEERIAEGESEQWAPATLSRYYQGLGSVHLTDERFDAAADAYRRAIELDNWSATARLGLGKTFSKQGNGAEARAQFEISVDLAPGSSEAQLALADSLDEQGEKEQALAIYRATAEAHAGNVPANLALARALQERGQWKAAEAAYRQALTVAPGDTNAHVGLADLYALQARHDEAEELLRAATELDRDSAQAHIRLGELMARRARYEEALVAYEEAIEIEAGNWRAYAGLGSVHHALGQTDQAIETFMRAAGAEQSVIGPLRELATVYREQGQLDRAEETLLLALARSPGNASIRSALADLYQGWALSDAALIQLQLASEENPSSTEAMVGYANGLLLQGREVDAQALYERAERSGAPSAAGYRALASAYQNQGQREKALALIEQAIIHAPGDVANWIAKGTLLVRMEDEEDALDALERATALRPAEGQAWVALGDAQSAFGRPEEAVRALERSIAVEPTHMPAYEALTQAYQDLGREQENARVAQAAMAAVPGSYQGDVLTARHLESQQAWAEAQAALEQALAKAPGEPRPLMAMGELERLRHNADGAIPWYERAVGVRPGDQTSNLKLIDLLLDRGQTREALARAEEGLESRAGDSKLLLRLGKVQRKMGQFDEAEATLLRSAELNYIDGAPDAELAALYLTQGRSGAAIAAYERAISLSPDEGAYCLALSQAWLKEGRPDEGLAALKGGLEAAKDPTTLYAALSRLYERQGQSSQALHTLEEAMQEYGEEPQLLQALGEYHQSQGAFDRAEEAYLSLVSLYPDSVASHLTLGGFYLDRGRKTSALASYRQAISVDPYSAAARLALGKAYRETAQSAMTAPLLREALDLEPGSIDARLALSSLHLAEGLPREAELHAQQALEVWPASPLAFVALGNAHHALGDTESAERDYRRAIELDLARSDGYRALADLYLAEGRYAEAIESAQGAIRAMPLDASLWIGLGDLYTKLGRYRDAISAFEQAAEMNPESPTPWRHQGEGYMLLGDMAAAQAALEQALSMQPKEPTSLLALAEFYEAQGNLERAEAYARQAVAVNPSGAGAYATLARILAATTRNDEAIENYLATVQRDPRQYAAYESWARLHLDLIRRRRIRIGKTRLEEALAEIEASPDADTLWAHVLLSTGYETLEGMTDRVLGHLEEAYARDPVFAELQQRLALAYEEHMDGRAALAAWKRYLYARGQGVDAHGVYVAEARVDWLSQTHIEHPADGARVFGSVEITGTATGDDFQFYRLEYAAAESPDDWRLVSEPVYEAVEDGLLATWPTEGLASGEYRLRLTVADVTGNYGPYDEIGVRLGNDGGGRTGGE
jgi:tetratricopeptide (TPR) repeat protein